MLILTRADVARSLSLDDCIEGLERAFRAQAEGRTLPSRAVGVPSGDGGFHVKAAGLSGRGGDYFAAKCNGNFADNPRRSGLPAIQGVVVLCDGRTGTPLAVMDSIEITLLRTAAATVVAARRLARPDARTAALCGCGSQGRVQLRALARALPLARARLWDVDAARAAALAAELSAALGLPVEPAPDVAAAVARCDVCVTCTPSREPFLRREHVPPGAFVAAVGADHPDKRELDLELLASATLVVDSREQCAAFGELHHALAAGALSGASPPAELHEVVAGLRPGRRSADEIVVFDSTGIALEDAAAAVRAYERALETGRGTRVALAS